MILKNQIITNIKIESVNDLYKLKPFLEDGTLKINKSQIARELEVDRRTVDKYINGYTKPELWSELAAKQEEIEGEESGVVNDFRAKTEEKFHQIDGMSATEIESIVSDYVQSKIEENILDADVVGVVISGSRCRGVEKVGSDLDVVLEYKGSVREDTFFDILHEDGMEIGGVKVDINPITEGKSETLESYLPEVERYLEQKELIQERKPSVKNKLKEQKTKTTNRKKDIKNNENIR